MYPKYPRAKTSPIPVTNHKLVAMLGSCPFQRNGPKFPKLRKVKNNSGYGKTNSTQTSIQHDEHSKPISQNQSKRMMRHVPFKSVRNKRSVLWGRVQGRGIPFPGDFQKASTPPPNNLCLSRRTQASPNHQNRFGFTSQAIITQHTQSKPTSTTMDTKDTMATMEN
jgi:hypothetical protein